MVNQILNNKVIGVITSKGCMSFNGGLPLDVKSIPKICIYPEFYEGDNKQYVLYNRILYNAYKQNKKLCRKHNINYDLYMLVLNDVSGDNYKSILTNISHLLFAIHQLNIKICKPINLLSFDRVVGLYSIDENEDSLESFNSKNLLPFTISNKFNYFVVSVKKSDIKLCKDNSFETITLVNKEVSEMYQTYIRIVCDGGRWSEWLEYKDDLMVPINIYRLHLEIEKLIQNYGYKITPSYNFNIDGDYIVTCYYNCKDRIINLNKEMDIGKYSNDEYSLMIISYMYGNMDYKLHTRTKEVIF